MIHIKRTILFTLLILTLSTSLHSAEGFTVGFNIMLGGRYDNIRMCVASPAGAKGGMIMDVMLDFRVWVNERFAVGLKVPVMRPILFALAFNMLQFEPEITFEFKRKMNEKLDLRSGFGLGASFHYGPDYTSSMDNKGPSFFAAGPFLSGLVGLGFDTPKGRDMLAGVRVFYAPLLSKSQPLGTILGGALEFHMDFVASP